MKAFQLEVTCTMDDGQELVALIDQRDRAAYEASDLYGAEPEPSEIMRTRWLAWHALKRTSKLTMTWPVFNLEQCAGALATDWPGKGEQEQESKEGEQEPDPSRS